MNIDEIKEKIRKAAQPTMGTGPEFYDSVCDSNLNERQCFMNYPIHVGTTINGQIETVSFWTYDDTPDLSGVDQIPVDDLARIVKAIIEVD